MSILKAPVCKVITTGLDKLLVNVAPLIYLDFNW